MTTAPSGRAADPGPREGTETEVALLLNDSAAAPQWPSRASILERMRELSASYREALAAQMSAPEGFFATAAPAYTYRTVALAPGGPSTLLGGDAIDQQIIRMQMQHAFEAMNERVLGGSPAPVAWGRAARGPKETPVWGSAQAAAEHREYNRMRNSSGTERAVLDYDERLFRAVLKEGGAPPHQAAPSDFRWEWSEDGSAWRPWPPGLTPSGRPMVGEAEMLEQMVP